MADVLQTEQEMYFRDFSLTTQQSRPVFSSVPFPQYLFLFSTTTVLNSIPVMSRVGYFLGTAWCGPACREIRGGSRDSPGYPVRSSVLVLILPQHTPPHSAPGSSHKHARTPPYTFGQRVGGRKIRVRCPRCPRLPISATSGLLTSAAS